MYDTALTLAVLERLGDVLRDLLNHPAKGLLVLGGIVLVAWWVTRK